MDYQQLLNRLSPDIVDRLRRGVETGRWPDGTALSDAQREHSLQAVIAWDSRHRPAGERVGYVHKGVDRGAQQEVHQEVHQEAHKEMQKPPQPAMQSRHSRAASAESELRWVDERRRDGA